MSAKLDVRGRRKARRALVQALYQWRMNEASAADLAAEFSASGALKGADRPFFNQVLETALARTEELDSLYEGVLDRARERLDGVELAILRLGVCELLCRESYHWPGNVRELENCIERAVLLSNDDVIHGHHLPPTLQTAEASGTTPSGSLQGTIDAIERELIQDALKWAKGNMARAARSLQISERIMGLRVRKHRIDLAAYKN